MEPITPEQLTNLCQEALAEVVEEVRQQPATYHLLEYKMSNECREGVFDNCSSRSNNQFRTRDLYRSQIIEFNRSKNLDGTGWDGMGLGWMVIIGHRSSKSTFGANERSPQRVSKMILLLQ